MTAQCSSQRDTPKPTPHRQPTLTSLQYDLSPILADRPRLPDMPYILPRPTLERAPQPRQRAAQALFVFPLFALGRLGEIGLEVEELVELDGRVRVDWVRGRRGFEIGRDGRGGPASYDDYCEGQVGGHDTSTRYVMRDTVRGGRGCGVLVLTGCALWHDRNALAQLRNVRLADPTPYACQPRFCSQTTGPPTEMPDEHNDHSPPSRDLSKRQLLPIFIDYFYRSSLCEAFGGRWGGRVDRLGSAAGV
jgi:hypothetical protein